MINILRYASTLAIATVLFVCVASADTYTAVQSGNWSADSTWGGVPAPASIRNDTVVIPVGVAVKIDQQLFIEGHLGVLRVDGSLLSIPNRLYYSWLVVDSGTFTGSGALTVFEMWFGSAAVIDFTGSAVADNLRSSAQSFRLKSYLRVMKLLQIREGTFTVANGGELELSTNASLWLGPGSFAIEGGLFSTKSYRVSYENGPVRSPGIELSGNGLSSVNINSTVVLDRDLTLNAITISAGSLLLNGHHLTVNVFANSYYGGPVVTTATSSLTVKRKSTGAIRFQDDATILNLTVGTIGTDSVAISGKVFVRKLLEANGTLLLRSCSLTVDGSVYGDYVVSGDENSSLSINTSGSMVTRLGFAPNGQILKNLTVSVGRGKHLELTSSLNVVGVLDIPTGEFDVRNASLTLNRSTTGTGSIVVGDSTRLTIVGSDGILKPLPLQGASVGTLEIATGRGVRVLIGADLIVSKALRLVKGTLVLNGYDLTNSGDIFSDSGLIHSTTQSNVTTRGKNTIWADKGGWWSFEEGGNEVGNYTVDIDSGANAAFRGTVSVRDELRLIGGTLQAYRAYDKRYGPDDSLFVHGIITGAGSISGTHLTVTVNSAVENSSVEDMYVKNLVLVGPTNRLHVGNAITVTNKLELSSGNLDVRNAKLTVKDTISGTGGIETNGKTVTKLVLPRGLVQPLPFISDSLGDLTIETDSAATLSLARDLNVLGTLIYYRGALDLKGHDLSVHNSILMSERSRISSTSASDIYVASNKKNPGEIFFDRGADTVNNFTTNFTMKQSLALRSNITILGTLDLQMGRLFVGNDTLTMGDEATIVRANDSTYVSTGHDATLGMRVSSSDTSPTLYPVGTGYGYFPAILRLTSASTDGMVYVGARRGVPTGGVIAGLNSPASEPGNFVWNIVSSIAPGFEFDLELGWQPGSERPTFDRSQAYISNFVNNAWDASAPTTAMAQRDSLYTLSRFGLESVGQFTIFSATPTHIDENQTDQDGAHNEQKGSAFTYTPRVYPSPASDFIVIDAPIDYHLPMSLDIVDVHGRIVLSGSLTEANHKVSILELCNGVYYVRLSGAGTSTTTLFVKL